MTAIRIDQWCSAFTRDQRLKIACAYTMQFKRADLRHALLNNQNQGPALDRLEAFMMPLIRGEMWPGSWTMEQCKHALAAPLRELVSNLEGMQLGAYWHVLTAERKATVKARVLRALGELGCQVDFHALMMV